MSARKRIAVDANRCSGHGRCYTIAPDVFDPDDEGFPVLLVDHLVMGADGSEDVLAAVDNCPERAISLVDEVGA